MPRQYTYFEYIAAKLYYDDVKLHHYLDLVTENPYKEIDWNVKLNFHDLWHKLPLNKKESYLSLAKQDFYEQKETRQR